jgi:hypothetical protein
MYCNTQCAICQAKGCKTFLLSKNKCKGKEGKEATDLESTCVVIFFSVSFPYHFQASKEMFKISSKTFESFTK